MTNFEVLTAQDIAKILKVSRATAYEIMERTDFPTIRIGRNKRVMDKTEKIIPTGSLDTVSENEFSVQSLCNS